MECEQIDLNNVCRTCKNESPEMKSLYHRDSESGKENPRLDEMLMACTSVQVNNEDGLPKIICRSCFVQLKNAFFFKEQCEKTDVFLKNYLKNLKKEDIKEEILLNDGEFPSNVIDEIESTLTDVNSDGDDKDITETIKDDPEIQTVESQQKDMDYVQVVDDNLTIFECRTCSKIFFTIEGLRVHKRVHTGKTFKCKQCDKSYIRLNHLRRHELTHNIHKVHICKICNKTLTRFQHLKRHLLTHLKEKPFCCTTCNRGFNRVEQFQSHVKICKGEIFFICDICNKAFSREVSLEVHRRLHENKLPVLPTLENLNNIEEHYVQIDFNDKMDEFPIQSDDADDDDEDDIEDMDMGEDTMEPEVQVSENNDQEKIDEIAQITNEIYAEVDPAEMLVEKAIIENEIYKEIEEAQEEESITEADNGNNYESDVSTHSEYLPTKPSSPKIKKGRGRPRKYPVSFKHTGRPRGRPPLKLKIKIESENENGNYPCPQCKQVFTKISLLEKHADKHQGLRIHECETCHKKFNRINSLKRHNLSHVEVKPFLCMTCRKCFTRSDHLQKHMKLHTSTEVYTCDLCHVVFTKEESLTRHKAHKHDIGEKVVIGEKKYKCQYCQKGFTTEKYRDSHMKAHFGDKKFQCRTCEKTFISKSHLTEHMKFHNDSSKKFLCSECGQRFIRNDYLVIHMRRHRGEKPFKCKFCGKGFPRTTDLTVHERYHTGEKTHLCVICGRGFGRAYNLTVHMRTHTGEKPYRCTYCDAAFAQGNDLKAHVRRHTGERYHCDLCPETFLMGYLLTQHKRVVHGLNIVSNIRRLQPINKLNPDDPPAIAVSLPAPVVVSSAITSDPLQIQENDMPELKQE